MSKTFTYKEENEQGWLVGEKDKFKYDYPDPGKEMELGKDFEVQYQWFARIPIYEPPTWQKCSIDMYNIWDKDKRRIVAIPITQRTYSEQEENEQQKAINWAAKIIDWQKLEIQRLKGLIELMFADSEIIKGSWQTFKNENNL